MNSRILVLAALSPLALWADVVELRDGTRIDGVILSENETSLEIQIGANPAGTIRRVLIIDASEIKTWAADAERRVRRPEGEVLRLEGNAYVERLIRDAQAKVGDKDYDAAITQFREAAETASLDTGEADTEDKVASLELSAHAYTLMETTLEAKLEMLESKSAGLKDGVKEERKRLEKAWDELQEEVEKDKKEREGPRRAELGARHIATDLQKREEELRLEIDQLRLREGRVESYLTQIEEERIATDAQRRLAAEQVEKAEDQAKLARRNLRKRR